MESRENNSLLKPHNITYKKTNTNVSVWDITSAVRACTWLQFSAIQWEPKAFLIEKWHTTNQTTPPSGDTKSFLPVTTVRSPDLHSSSFALPPFILISRWILRQLLNTCQCICKSTVPCKIWNGKANSFVFAVHTRHLDLISTDQCEMKVQSSSFYFLVLAYVYIKPHWM